jgi:glutamate decarboxylase
MISSTLESDRVCELENVLTRLTQQLVSYVQIADGPEGKVGNYSEATELARNLPIELPGEGQGIEGFFQNVDTLLNNSVVTWHQGFLDKLYASTNPVGVASDMLLSILNTNSHVYTVSPALTIIEKKTAREYAKIIGFKGPRAGGLTFPGGSYSNSTSVTVARSILYPNTKLHGNTHKFALFASTHCHYSVEKAAIFCGFGSESLFVVDINNDGTMNVADLQVKIELAKSTGYTPLYVNATAGTTVYGSFDDFNAIADVTEKQEMWFHIDGSWGGNVAFSDKYRYKLAGADRANSFTVNPHKMLGVPCTCSFLLVPDESILQQANSLQAPYLFHNSVSGEENFDLADGTMGCGRRADALKLYLGWNWYGKSGYGQRIEHAFEITKYLATKVRDTKGFLLVSEYPPPCLQTCFYYCCDGKLSEDGAVNSKTTRRIVQELFRRSKFLVDYAPHENGSGEFFRVVVNSPVYVLFLGS